LKEDVKKQSEQNKKQSEEIRKQSEENEHLRYLVKYFRDLKFAVKSEKTNNSPQSLLFNEAEVVASGNPDSSKDEEIAVKSHKRKRGGRRAFPKEIPRIEIPHDLSDEEKQCTCGNVMTVLEREIKEKLDIIPAKIIVYQHIYPKYACLPCLNGKKPGHHFKVAEIHPEILPKSIATAGLFAHILTNKFCDHLPYNRQEGIFARHGIDISKANMCNWQTQFYEQYDRLENFFFDDIFHAPVIIADETTNKVMNEPGRKNTQLSYMFAFAALFKGRPIRLFHYRETRSAKFLKDHFEGYSGILQTDGFKSYDPLCKVLNIPHAGCWAHLRRKFRDYLNFLPKDTFSGEILKKIKALYQLERDWREEKIDPNRLRQHRQEFSKPIVIEIFNLIEARKNEILPQSDLGKIVSHAIKQKTKLFMFLEFPQLALDTNAVENAIRPFAVGRKNWMISGSPRGAHSSALIYSLIETAKANGLNPYYYLRYLFEKLPLCKNDEEIKQLLPHRIDPKIIEDTSI